MFNSLKSKITITAFLIISVIMILSTWRDINETERLLLEGHREKAALLSDRIVHSIMVLMTENKWRDMQALMESLVRDRKELKKIRILRPEDGVIVVSSEPEETGKAFKTTVTILKDGRVADASTGWQSNAEYLSKLTVIKNRKACHGCHDSRKDVLGILAVDISLDDVTAAVREFKKEHLREAVIGFLLIMGAFTFVVGVLIDRPIRKMIATIRKIENGDLSARMDENKKDEFGLVAKSFNRMLETLES
ncbi:MAG: HAMP domain-containing protein, partial [Deferribacteres bacterium]|nr:HAMP domain-containing protein [Deferribacteres bacterium]